MPDSVDRRLEEGRRQADDVPAGHGEYGRAPKRRIPYAEHGLPVGCPVTPLGMDVFDDLPSAIANEGATLRVLPSLWGLHDAVRSSSLVYSMIRMRNAAGR